MAYIVDIIIIAVFALTVFLSYKKGFVKSLFDLGGSLVAIIAARLLSKSFAPVGFEMFVEKPARATLTNTLGAVGTTDYGSQVEQAINSIPDSLAGIMDLIGIDKQSILDKVSSSELAQGTLVDNIMENIVTPVGTAVIQFILFALLSLVLSVALKLVVKLLDFIVKKLPVAKQLNSGLGVFVGILRGLIVTLILSMVLGVVVSFIGNEQIIEAVNNSTIVSAAQSLISSLSGAVLK